MRGTKEAETTSLQQRVKKFHFISFHYKVLWAGLLALINFAHQNEKGVYYLNAFLLKNKTQNEMVA